MDEQERLRARIQQLQVAYFVLFVGSLVMLGVNWGVLGHTVAGTAVWGVLLGSAVLVRLYRTSLVNQHNTMMLGKDAPLS